MPTQGKCRGIPRRFNREPGRSEGPLRVALFTDANVFAGTERHMLDLARGLRMEGAKPIIACPRISVLGDRSREEGIEHIAIEKGGFIDRPAIRILREKLRSGEVDVIHAHNGRSALSAALAVMLERRGGYVLTQHFLSPSRATRRGLKAGLSSAVHRWISKGAGHIIAISEATRRGIEERGEASGNVTTVPNGIPAPDPANLTPPAEVRAAFGIAADEPLLFARRALKRRRMWHPLLPRFRQCLRRLQRRVASWPARDPCARSWRRRSKRWGLEIRCSSQGFAVMRFRS
jgi:hypothetical protein